MSTKNTLGFSSYFFVTFVPFVVKSSCDGYSGSGRPLVSGAQMSAIKPTM
jgi:hypothetical protein